MVVSKVLLVGFGEESLRFGFDATSCFFWGLKGAGNGFSGLRVQGAVGGLCTLWCCPFWELAVWGR